MIDIDAVVLKLVAVAKAALPGLQVLDGKTYRLEVADHALLVGYSPNPEQLPAVNVSRSLDDGGIGSTRYDVAVMCRLMVSDGEEEFAKKRAVAQGHMTALDAAIRADVQLGGLAYEAWLAPDQSWYEISDDEGAAIEIDLTVTVSVFA